MEKEEEITEKEEVTDFERSNRRRREILGDMSIGFLG